MNLDSLIRRTIKISQVRIFKFFFQVIEIFVFSYYNRRFKKRKNINTKFFTFFQLYCGAKVSSLYRRRKYEILSEKLDLNLELDKQVNEINNQSYVKLFELSSEEVKKTVEYFYKQKINTSHVPTNASFSNKLIGTDEFLNTSDTNYNYGSFDIKTSLNSSVVNKVCSNEHIWKFAKKYLNNDDIKIYSINTMLTKKSEKKNYVVNLHVDFDSANMMTFFIYWTDVTKNNGATRILPGSHLFLHDRKLASYVNEPLTKHLEDKAGSLYAVDTWALHAGNPNITSPRLVTWIRFSSMPASTYYLDRNYLFKAPKFKMMRVPNQLPRYITEDQFEKICKPAFEDITSICDEMNFQIKCGNEYIIDFLENIIKSYRNNESIFKKQIEIEPNL